MVRRANRQHVVHGGERGYAGADGPDGHVRPRGSGRLPALRGRGQQCCLTCHRYTQQQTGNTCFPGLEYILFFPLLIPLRSRCGVFHHRDQPPGAHPGRAPTQALLPVVHLHGFSQPGHGGRRGGRGRRGD